MIRRRLAATAVAATAALATTVTAVPAADAATAHHARLGTSSLAALLASDGDTFDHDRDDYDIVYQAVLAVLAAKPDSAVGVLADGTVPLTAFIPTDRAFRRLAHALTGTWYQSEGKIFSVLAGAVGVDTLEAVLLYHVVPGATITWGQAKQSDDAALTTALGATFTVQVYPRPGRIPTVYLQDNDPNAANPKVNDHNLNKGNRQIAHGINRVLRPVDL